MQNEASLQLQFASILKTMGELMICSPTDRFSIELEKSVISEDIFAKSSTRRANIDIWFEHGEMTCAVELKFFKKENHREPNNRYDVFKDISNLESYASDLGFMVVLTDHKHYVSQNKYSEATADFDFRNGSQYKSGTRLTYDTDKPYGPAIELRNDYLFEWTTISEHLFALVVLVD